MENGAGDKSGSMKKKMSEAWVDGVTLYSTMVASLTWLEERQYSQGSDESGSDEVGKFRLGIGGKACICHQ